MSKPATAALVQQPTMVLAVLLAVLAALFAIDAHPRLRRLFKVVPLLVFAYFVPTLLSNTGVIPLASPLYTFIKQQLLPASLFLLVLSVDIPAVLKLGKPALVMFFTATASIVVGGPLAYLALGALVPKALGEQTWKGLAAVAGSWIGGGANYLAIGQSVGASDSTLSMMVIVDVAISNVWMAVLLYFAGREEKIDARIEADRASLDALRAKVEAFIADTAKPTTLPALLGILALAVGATALATAASRVLPPIGTVISAFTWVVVVTTTLGLGASFTPLRRLEGLGASKLGSVFVYLLVASIGAKAELAKVLAAWQVAMVGALWMAIHAASVLVVRRVIRAPVFFAAVGSQANVGGAASAPIVAAAFHPALAPVGVLLAIFGYVLGTYAGLLCAQLLELVHGVVF